MIFILPVLFVWTVMTTHSFKYKVELNVDVTENIMSTMVHSVNFTTEKYPFAYTVEFLVNNRSFATIGFLEGSGKCVLGRKLCQPNQCSCKPNWYIYNETIELDIKINNISCQSRYNNSCGSHDSIEQTVVLEGSGIYNYFIQYSAK